MAENLNRFSRVGNRDQDQLLKDLRDLQQQVDRLEARLAELEKKNG